MDNTAGERGTDLHIVDIGTRLFIEKVVDLLLNSPSHETRNNIVLMVENDKKLQQTFVAEFERRLKDFPQRSIKKKQRTGIPGDNSTHTNSKFVGEFSMFSSSFDDYFDEIPSLKIPKTESLKEEDSSCQSTKVSDDRCYNIPVYQESQQFEVMQDQQHTFPDCQVTCTMGNQVNGAFSTTTTSSTYIEKEFISEHTQNDPETSPTDAMSRMQEATTNRSTATEFSSSNNIIPLLTSYSVHEFSEDGYGGNYFLY